MSDMAHFQEPITHICQQTSLCILTKNFTNQGRMGIARKTGTKNNYGENDIYTFTNWHYLPKPPINKHDFLPVECNPLSMEANEYLAYTISRMYPTNIFRCIHSGEGLKHHHRIIQLQEICMIILRDVWCTLLSWRQPMKSLEKMRIHLAWVLSSA